jgi:hypothetical protein
MPAFWQALWLKLGNVQEQIPFTINGPFVQILVGH